MKRVFKSVCVVLSCVLCLCFVGGCNNSPVVTTYEDAVQALKNAGYENAYCDNFHGDIYLGTDNGVRMSVTHPKNGDKFAEIEGCMALSDQYTYWISVDYNTDLESCKYDCAKILDTVMPMVDREYNENALDIINQSLEYQKNHVYEFEKNTDEDYSTKWIRFQKSKYTVSYTIDKHDFNGGISYYIYIG